jgi:hypothetical protein
MSETELNWVDARAECSLGPMFAKLYLGCEEDVQARNKLLFSGETPARRRHFSVKLNDAKTKFVVCEDSDQRSVVTFSLRDSQIEIEAPNEVLSLTVSLDVHGKCKLSVNGQVVLDHWQVRKTVLEELFFGR